MTVVVLWYSYVAINFSGVHDFTLWLTVFIFNKALVCYEIFAHNVFKTLETLFNKQIYFLIERNL